MKLVGDGPPSSPNPLRVPQMQMHLDAIDAQIAIPELQRLAASYHGRKASQLMQDSSFCSLPRAHLR